MRKEYLATTGSRESLIAAVCARARERADGAVEGACKHVVVDRLRQSGMRWQLATAEPVLALRAALLTQPRLDFRAYAANKRTIAST